MRIKELELGKFRLDGFSYIDEKTLKVKRGDTWQRIFGIFDKDKMVAISCLSKYHGRYVLENTEVLPSHRGLGLQRKLVEHRLMYVPPKAIVEVWVDGDYSRCNINFMKDVHPEYRWDVFDA